MQRIAMWRRQFNWRMLLMRMVVNALALLITAALVPDIYFVNRTFLAWIVMAIALGVLNALIKPLIQFATLRFIFATYGLVLVFINTILLLLMAWLFPAHFEVTGAFWALVGGAVIGISSAVLENLLGITPPIVSEKYPELRERIEAREASSMEAIITQSVVGDSLQPDGGAPQEASRAASAAAILAAVDAGNDTSAAPDQATAPAGQEG